MSLPNAKADPIVIQHTIRGPESCPVCGADGDNLICANDGKGSPKTPHNPNGWPIEFIGYDCRNCGQRLRFLCHDYRSWYASFCI